MIIGIPRERKPDERRVALTPAGARRLAESGHKVLVESGAGTLSGFGDEEYSAAGANVLPTLADVWNGCELLVKVKEPAPEELELFRPGLAVFSFLHLAVAPTVTKALVEAEVIGLDYDLVMLDDGRLPVLEPMSIVAGKLAIQCGAYALQAGNGGRGVLLGGTPNVTSAKVVVIGGGAAGSNAASVALGMGAQTTILEVSDRRISALRAAFPKAKVIASTPEAITSELKEASLIVGSVLIPGALAPKLVKRAHLKEMHPGSVIVDVCIDQGGMAETSRPTTISDPTYVEEGIVHYCVTNMPALVPRTSTEALTHETLKWIVQFADKGIEEALRTEPPLRRCLTTYRGQLTNTAIGDALGMDVLPDEEVQALLNERR